VHDDVARLGAVAVEELADVRVAGLSSDRKRYTSMSLPSSRSTSWERSLSVYRCSLVQSHRA
jgi:hypothetical protein